MAKVKGREVVVELMDAVEKLQATGAEHSELLEQMARDAADTTAHFTALTALAAHTAKRANEFSQEMDEISGRVETTSQLMGELAEQMALNAQRLAVLELDSQGALENARRSAELGRMNQTRLGEVARWLGKFAEQSNTRFDDIEGRLTKLERKAS